MGDLIAEDLTPEDLAAEDLTVEDLTAEDLTVEDLTAEDLTEDLGWALPLPFPVLRLATTVAGVRRWRWTLPTTTTAFDESQWGRSWKRYRGQQCTVAMDEATEAGRARFRLYDFEFAPPEKERLAGGIWQRHCGNQHV